MHHKNLTKLASPSSTRLISRGLAAHLDSTPLRYDDDDCVTLTAEEIDPSDYIILNNLHFNTNEYRPSDLNKILLKQYEKKFSYPARLTDENSNLFASVFQGKQKKIILFKTVKDYEDSITEKQLKSLDAILTLYKNKREHNSDDIIVIPIAELARKHFRLLTIADNKIEYYDSKSALTNVATRSVAPLLPALQTACNQTEKMLHKKIKAYYETKDESNTNKPTLNTLDCAMLLSLALGHLAYKTVTNYPNFHDCVRHICKKHFPEYRFNELTLAHQAYDQHTDCGVYTAEYARCVASGDSPAELKKDPILIRADHYELDTVDEKQVEQIKSMLTIQAGYFSSSSPKP